MYLILLLYSKNWINQRYSRKIQPRCPSIFIFVSFFAYLKSLLPFEISKPIYYVEKTKNSWIDFSEFSIYLFSNRSFQYHQNVLTTRGLTELFFRDFCDIIPGLTFRKFGKSGIIEAPVMSISHSVIESVLKKSFCFQFL